MYIPASQHYTVPQGPSNATPKTASQGGVSAPNARPAPNGANNGPDRNDGSQQGNLRFNEAEQKALQELKARDREVRAHEQAHMTAGAGIVRGGMSFSYQRGPDGALYAIGGEVSIDTSREPTPEETLRKAEQIRRAALAPAEPSSQDQRVAAQATQMAAEARTKITSGPEEESQQGRPAGAEDGAPFNIDGRQRAGQLYSETANPAPREVIDAYV